MDLWDPIRTPVPTHPAFHRYQNRLHRDPSVPNSQISRVTQQQGCRSHRFGPSLLRKKFLLEVPNWIEDRNGRDDFLPLPKDPLMNRREFRYL